MAIRSALRAPIQGRDLIGEHDTFDAETRWNRHLEGIALCAARHGTEEREPESIVSGLG